jgi:AcrR family transcriptional regulator
MVDSVKKQAAKTTRPYHSPRRQQQAQQTRRSIIDAATTLFTVDGYGATSLQAIADHAQISVQRLHAIFDSKAALLAEALDVAIAGDHLEVPINAREWMQPVWDAPTAPERLQAYAAAVRRILAGAGDMLRVLDAAAAADANLAQLASETEHRRRLGARSVIKSVTEIGSLRPGLTTKRAIDILWLLNGPQVFHHLVRQARWTESHYQAWLAQTMIEQLLDAPVGDALDRFQESATARSSSEATT